MTDKTHMIKCFCCCCCFFTCEWGIQTLFFLASSHPWQEVPVLVVAAAIPGCWNAVCTCSNLYITTWELEAIKSRLKLEFVLTRWSTCLPAPSYSLFKELSSRSNASEIIWKFGAACSISGLSFYLSQQRKAIMVWLTFLSQLCHS